MNKIFKYALICVGVVSFIELQIITYTSINNMININTNKPMEINSLSKNKDMRDNGIEAPGGSMGDISENAITLDGKGISVSANFGSSYAKMDNTQVSIDNPKW